APRDHRGRPRRQAEEGPPAHPRGVQGPGARRGHLHPPSRAPDDHGRDRGQHPAPDHEAGAGVGPVAQDVGDARRPHRPPSGPRGCRRRAREAPRPLPHRDPHPGRLTARRRRREIPPGRVHPNRTQATNTWCQHHPHTRRTTMRTTAARRAALGSAAGLTLLALAAPATAATGDAAQLSVLHGVPDLTVDVYVNGELTLDDFEPATLAGPLELPAGAYSVALTAADAADDSEPVL